MRFLILSIAVLTLSGCVSPTKVMTPLNEKESGIRNIQTVTVSYSDLSEDKLKAMDSKAKLEGQEKGEADLTKYLPLKEALEKIAKERLEERDTDQSSFANVEIEIDNLKLVDPVVAALIGDQDQLSGTVRVYDSKTNDLLTEFYVDVLEGSGGLLGLAIRGFGVRERLSQQFADHIGNQLGFPEIENENAYVSNTEN